MSTINRTNILRGPGAAIIGTGPSAITLHDATGITAELNSSTQDVPSSISGTLDTIKTDQTATITLTPCGQLSDAILAALYPHQTPSIGASLLGPTDTPLAVHSLAGTRVEFVAAALTACPELILSPIATAFGQATYTALLGLGKLPDSEHAFYKLLATPYTAGAPDPTNITGVHYTATYGDLLTIPDTLNGWRVQVELAIDPVLTDSAGTIDLTLSSVTVRASCTPLGITEAQLLAALPIAKPRGATIATDSDLVITGTGGLTVTLHRAGLVTGPLQWGNTTLRAGQLGFVAHRKFTGATPGALYNIALTPTPPPPGGDN